MAITTIRAEPAGYQKESSSTEGWTTIDHVQFVMNTMKEEITRLKAQRDRLRIALHLAYDITQNRTTFPEEVERGYSLNRGDMTDD